MRATEKRTRLWLIVFRRREVTVAELAEELHVSIRTIKYDLPAWYTSIPSTRFAEDT